MKIMTLASVRVLPDDSELERERPTNWSDKLPTRVLIRILIAHGIYHAGEINHIRVLLQETDSGHTSNVSLVRNSLHDENKLKIAYTILNFINVASIML